LGVFLLVFLAIFPLVVPFILIESDLLALRISNATAVCLMFFAGYSFGRFTGSHPWRAGLVMVALGLGVHQFTRVPISLATAQRKKIDPQGMLWNSVLASTGQSWDMR
jgi:VIT1/CCC1 family predicted Fe2+/Mn2+ transporter